MRRYLSRILTDTSENNPLKKKICLVSEEGFGLSSLNFPWIYEMWQNADGVICFVFDVAGGDVVEFDLMLTEDLLTICKEISE